MRKSWIKQQMAKYGKAAPTPGPWKIRECYSNGEPVEWAVESRHPEHSGLIASVYMTVDNDEQDAANARLIAASPDLYEALKGVLARLNSHTSSIESCDLPEETEDAIEQARAAIEKAEGKP